MSGHPLLWWSVQTCLTSGVFERVIVSTEDAEVAQIAREAGAEVPFVRPDNLADDYASTVDVISHAVRWLAEAGESLAHTCCVYPASIFLDGADLSESAGLLVEAQYVATVARYRHPVQRALIMETDGSLAFAHPEYAGVRTQDLEERWHDAGQFYWGRADAWLERLPILPNAVGYPVDGERVCDIDTEDDWLRAEQLHGLRARMNP